MIRPGRWTERGFPCAAALAAAVIGTAGAAGAQCTPGGPPNPASRRGALTGIVMDSAHAIIEGAEVLIERPARRVRTTANGQFVIDRLDPGTYTVSVRRIGYEMVMQDYTVGDSGGVARFCLIPDVTRLQPMISSSRRLGIGGVVGDSTYQPLPGAEVRVLGQDHVISDSAGGFFIPLKAGTYAVTFTKQGYGRQLVSVTVPKDSGRQIAIWLGSPPRNPNRMAFAYDDMRRRIDTANANRSALMSAEALAKTSASLRFAMAAAIRTKVPGPDCAAIIDGGPWQIPLDLIDKDEVATMEVYLEKEKRRGPTSINAQGSLQRSTTPASGGCGPWLIYVWLK